MTDDELIRKIEETIEALVGIHAALSARVVGVCLHERKVSVATFADPDGFMCPDCGVTG